MNNAEGQWQTKFMADMNDRYHKYDDGTYVSDKQLTIMEQISGVNRIMKTDEEIRAESKVQSRQYCEGDDDIPF
jgi:hypothetical protein